VKHHHVLKVLVLIVIALLVATAFGITRMQTSAAQPSVAEETLDPELVVKGSRSFANHYNRTLGLSLTPQQKADLEQYLKSL
jgi:hypothetical protein